MTVPVRVYDEMVGEPQEKLITETDFGFGSMIYGIPTSSMVHFLHLDPGMSELLLADHPHRVGYFYLEVDTPEADELESVYNAMMRAARQRRVRVVYTAIDPEDYVRADMSPQDAVAFYMSNGFEYLGTDAQDRHVLRKLL